MRSFNERNPVVVGVVGLVVTALVALGAFYWKKLPIINGSTGYHADFSEAAGLQSGDDVRIAGVQVGTVTGVSLEGLHVRVDFQVDGAWVGNASHAAIMIKTLLGQKFLAVEPSGTKPLGSGGTIPEKDTTSPYDVTTALEGLGSELGTINTGQLAKSFQVLANTFRNTPAAVRASLHGLSALSHVIASRDAALTRLLHSASRVTGVLHADDPQIGALLRDGNLLLQELQSRSAAITSLLKGTQALSAQLIGLVHDNDSTLAPALTQLDRVTTILQANQGNLDHALRLIGPYYRLLDDAVGNGPWLDTYICGLFTVQGVPQLDSTAHRNCSPAGTGR